VDLVESETREVHREDDREIAVGERTQDARQEELATVE
jgi:hypothetical protein